MSKLLGAALGATAAGLAHYALKVEPLRIGRSDLDLPVAQLPPSWDGLRILFLTDPHVWEFGERERRIVAACTGITPPDLIVWGGDFLGSARGIIPAIRLVKEIAALFPGVPTFGIWGNAEHKIRPERRAWFARLLTEAGVTLLVNESQALTLRGATVTLVGTDDPYYGFMDWEATFAEAPHDRFTLLLAHSPQVAAVAARQGVQLLLSGHTHGGQVRLPVLGPWKTQNPLTRLLDCGVFPHARLVSVLGYDPGGALTTFISRGLGVAYIAPFPWLAPRFLCPPEVVVLTLRPAQE